MIFAPKWRNVLTHFDVKMSKYGNHGKIRLAILCYDSRIMESYGQMKYGVFSPLFSPSKLTAKPDTLETLGDPVFFSSCLLSDPVFFTLVVIITSQTWRITLVVIITSHNMENHSSHHCFSNMKKRQDLIANKRRKSSITVVKYFTRFCRHAHFCGKILEVFFSSCLCHLFCFWIWLLCNWSANQSDFWHINYWCTCKYSNALGIVIQCTHTHTSARIISN